MSLNLASIVADSATAHPDVAAVRLGEAGLTYAELDDRSARVAAMLGARGVGRGDRVGVMLPNVLEFPVVYYGVLRAGGTVVPMNVLLKRREIAFYLEDSEARLMLAWHGFAEEALAGAVEAGVEPIEVEPSAFAALLGSFEPAAGLEPTDAEDTAVILYTSGTTGRPKGAELTHGNLRRNAEVTADGAICGIRPGDVVLGALPLFHSFGQTVSMNASLLGGATLTLLPRFDPGEALAIMHRDRVTHFYGVPTMYGALLHDPARGGTDTSSLRFCVTGGAAMPVEVLKAFEDAFGCELLEGYGLSETSPVASITHPGRPRKPGSIGTPIAGVEMRVVDESDEEVPRGEIGEIVIRGHNVMKGYWHRPDATAEALRGGWFHSGDLARVDEDRDFFIVDRKKDMIIRGGYNVYPREVEEVLYEHPKIREAAVLGVPDDEWGEEIAAAVVLHEGEELTPAEVSDYVRERIAAYKYPRVVWFMDELPKGPTGKILKREIEQPA
ncbi:MAG: long-chain-fatty-acid--CoA ligase [Syntrophothermus sp.]